MNERDRNKDWREEITERRRPPDVPAPPGKRDPCAEITAKLKAKRKELEAKKVEIKKLKADPK